MNDKVVTIGVAKGYLLKESLAFFNKLGIEPSEFSDRQLIFFDKTKKYRFMLLRPTDVPVYVEHGVVDIGITGMDIIKENKPDVIVLKDLGFGQCRLVVCNSELSKNDEFFSGLKVATKFVECTKEYFNNLGIKVDLIKLYGSVELAAITGLSDFIVDLVASGQTLKENKLKEVAPIFSSTAHLVVNKVFYSMNFPLIKELWKL